MRSLAKPYSVAEEIANSLSHGVGVIFGIIALVLMIVRSVQLDDTLRLVSFTIYGVSMILLFLASTLYHAIPYTGAKRVLKTLDHSAIYLLIAGTYTPIMLLTISDRAGAIVLALVWSLAVAGIVFKIFFVHRFHNFSLVTYLGMGWLGVFVGFELLHNMPTMGLGLIVLGGVAYSLGTIFYRWNRLPFNHAIWHLFVLAGCACHFLAVYYFVLPVA